MTSGVRTTNTILDRIVARKVEEVAALAPIDLSALASLPPAHDFAAALQREDGCVALIAEIKHASPSKGVLIEPFEPRRLAADYMAGGASALSVLTDRDFFMGSSEDLQAARSAVGNLPILRKDFTIDARQIHEARLIGADAILLIAAILDDARLADLQAEAQSVGLSVLVEVHTEEELARVLRINPRIVGINNRDLYTFKVDLSVFRTLAAQMPREVILVAESGISSVEDVEQMAAQCASAILVGESIVRAPDVIAQVRALAGVKRA